MGAIGGGLAVLTQSESARTRARPCRYRSSAPACSPAVMGLGVLSSTTPLVPSYIRDNLALFRIGAMWIGDVEGATLAMGLSGSWASDVDRRCRRTHRRRVRRLVARRQSSELRTRRAHPKRGAVGRGRGWNLGVGHRALSGIRPGGSPPGAHRSGPGRLLQRLQPLPRPDQEAARLGHAGRPQRGPRRGTGHGVPARPKQVRSQLATRSHGRSGGLAGAIFATTIEICSRQGEADCANNTKTTLDERTARFALVGTGVGHPLGVASDHGLRS